MLKQYHIIIMYVHLLQLANTSYAAKLRPPSPAVFWWDRMPSGQPSAQLNCTTLPQGEAHRMMTTYGPQCLNFIPAAPLNLLSWILPLLLSFSQLCSHLVNFLFQQTACIQLLCVRRTHTAKVIRQHAHHFPPAIDVYLLYSRAVSSLSCCLLVSSAAIWSTFWSVILYGAQMELRSTHEGGPGYYTVWPEILAGNLFWRIGGFESNPPIFHPPNKCHHYCEIIARRASLNSRHGVHH